MDKYDLKNIRSIDTAKRVSHIRGELEVDGFFIDGEIYRAS